MKYRAIALLMLLALLIAGTGCGPDKSVKYYNLGLDAVKRDDYEEAIRLWKESLAHRPDDPATRYNLGLALMNVKRYAEAEEQLREAVALDPLDHESQQLLGKCFEEQAKLTEAKRAYERSLNLKPTHVPSLLGLASIALMEDRNKTLEEYATRAAELDPNNIEANLLLAEAYYRGGDFNAAYGQLTSAQRLAASNPRLLFLLGKVSYARRMYEDAIEYLDAARTLGAPSDETFLYLGLSALALGNTAEAEKNLRLALYRNNENASAWKGLGEDYLKDRKWSDASEAINTAARLLPGDPEIALDDAIISLEQGDPAGAAEKLENLRRRSDAPRITDYYLAHAYLRAGKEAEARAAFGRFIETWEGDGALVEESKTILKRLAP